MKILNKKGVVDRPYIAGLHNEKVGIYAESLHMAKQRAIEYFRPKKKDRGLIWVQLADKEVFLDV